jgi:alkylation response protein AidB-like acyl-CoA dehydrogenase
MHKWSDTDLLIRDSVREFIDSEIRPNIDTLESGIEPPYELIRKMWAAFGIDVMASEMATKMFEAEEERAVRALDVTSCKPKRKATLPAEQASLAVVLFSELAGVSMGTVAAIGGSLGLCAATIASAGTLEQKKRWLPELLTFEKIGAWAITEPGAGSDAFGGMTATVTRDGDDFILSGQKTFITNAPYADTIVVYAKLAQDGVPKRKQKVLTFVLEADMPRLVRSKPLHKMGIASSPTGELFFDNVRITPDRLLGGADRYFGDRAESSRGGKESAVTTFLLERVGVAVLALGVINECHRLCVDYAKTRTAWGQRIGDFQLVQLKLAKMEIARVNVQNMIFQTLSQAQDGEMPSLATASAIKIYSSQAAHEVADEAVQLFGGNGYMAEYRVEQLVRDAKSLMIYAGTNEIQVTHVARGLLDG